MSHAHIPITIYLVWEYFQVHTYYHQLETQLQLSTGATKVCPIKTSIPSNMFVKCLDETFAYQCKLT